MDWRALPLTRFGVSVVMLTLAGSIVGCGSNRVYEQTIEETESSIAMLLNVTSTRTAELLSAHTALSEVSEADVEATFANDLRTYDGTTTGPAETRGVFDITENPDGTVSFSVIFGASAFGSAGLITTSNARHSCGILTGHFTNGELTVGDLDCPPDIESLVGDDSVGISMTDNAAKYGVEIGSSP